MLRRAVEEEWPEPQTTTISTENGQADSPGHVFAAHFYAGRAGHEDLPIAQPTEREVAAAEVFVKRLLKVWPDESRVAEWGREFGAHVRSAEQYLEQPIKSFSLALRSHGDSFYRDHKARKEGTDEEAERAAEDAHSKRHFPEYLEFVQTAVGKCGGRRSQSAAPMVC